ncbi:hypothetical protein BSNT_10080 [Bacillus subtilis subsp. natto BEST195]|nr:hypothetical protein BSNT_10080 [Bacillus subtilis subsp. natto BEST195]
MYFWGKWEKETTLHIRPAFCLTFIDQKCIM